MAARTCIACRYALYDGFCLWNERYTTLDAPACGEFAEGDVMIDDGYRLKSLLALVLPMVLGNPDICDACEMGRKSDCETLGCAIERYARELGVET